MVPAPPPVDPLDHLLAALVLEVHVDVGGLVAFAADEALEERVHAVRVDRGDAQAEADGAVGRGAAPLAEDAAATRERHDLVHGEEVGLVAEFLHQGQLVLQASGHGRGNALGPSLHGPRLHQRSQVVDGSNPLRRHIRGIPPAHLRQVEAAAALRHLHRTVERLRREIEQGLHGRPSLQVRLVVGGQRRAARFDRSTLAHGGEHVRQFTAARVVIARQVGGQRRHAQVRAQRQHLPQTQTFVGKTVAAHGHGQSLAEHASQSFGRLQEPLLGQSHARGRQHGGHEPAAAHLQRTQRALAAAMTVRDQTAQVGPAGQLEGPEQQLHGGGSRHGHVEAQPRPRHQPHAAAARGFERPHQPRDRVAVAHAQRRHAQFCRTIEEFVRVTRSFLEAEVAHAAQFHEAAHVQAPSSHHAAPSRRRHHQVP